MLSNSPHNRYRPPTVLRDLVLLDLLELTGSTTAAAAHLALSQPSVSRRYRALASDLGLERQHDGPVGRRYGNTVWLAWLRRGVNHHRLSCGVVRVGGSAQQGGVLRDCHWAEWVTLGRAAQAQWRQLLKLELLDAVALHQAPSSWDAGSSDLALLSVDCGWPQPLWLACRRQPEILSIVHAWTH
jgi:hypothetical protein